MIPIEKCDIPGSSYKKSLPVLFYRFLGGIIFQEFKLVFNGGELSGFIDSDQLSLLPSIPLAQHVSVVNSPPLI